MQDQCSKIGYPTEKRAREVVNSAHNHGGRHHKIPKRVYHCASCGQRHITSLPVYLEK